MVRFFLLTIKDNVPFSRDELVEQLEANNIQTRNLFADNIIRQPCFTDMREGIDYRVYGIPANTDKVMNDSFGLGVYPGMSDEKLIYMAEVIKRFIKKKVKQ